MKGKYDVFFLKEAIDFIEKLDDKTREKVLYNIDKARLLNDPRLLKKLEGEIWEFRTLYGGIHYRLFAFWDKLEKKRTLIISTHGIIKKDKKIHKSEIEKAEKIRIEYFNNKMKK